MCLSKSNKTVRSVSPARQKTPEKKCERHPGSPACCDKKKREYFWLEKRPTNKKNILKVVEKKEAGMPAKGGGAACRDGACMARI